jgi:arylsulfatase A-like enzyme
MRKAVIIGLSMVLVTLVFSYAGTDPKQESVKPNVIVIVLGTFRADHLGCYGYPKNTSPNLDKFAKECLVFKNAYSQSHWTLPSHCSILTSRYPSVHGVMERTAKLDPAEVTLPEILKNYDFQTAAFTGGLDMKKEHGLDQGFDIYSDDAGDKILGTSDKIFPKAINWLDSAKNDKPFFLYIHTYDTHLPYAPPVPYNTMFASKDYNGQFKGKELSYEYLKAISGPLSKADIDYVVSQYDGEVAYQDKQLGLFLDKIREMGIDKNTIIVITADHGESLYDYGTWDRFGSEDLYNSTLKVPLMIRLIEKQSGVIESNVQLIDIMPSVLKQIGIPANKESQGIDILAKKQARNYSIAEASMVKQSFTKGPWKLIAASSSYELYDLDKDPQEKNNRAPKNPDQVYGLVQELMGLLKGIRSERREPPRITLSPQMIEELRKSGYWEKSEDNPADRVPDDD